MQKKLPKILVTGGAGFIGSEFVRQAVGKGYRVTVVDKLTYAGDRERLRDHMRRIVFYETDICDAGKMRSVFAQERPDTVAHFAAESHVDRSIEDAAPFIKTNIAGSQILLDLSRKYQIRKFVHVSCYDEKTRALTIEGLKTYKQLRNGDKVFSLNPVTQAIEIKRIEKVIVQHYDGEMIHFKNKRMDLLVTPNHRMFIFNTSKRKRNIVIETAKESSQRSIFYMPEGRWTGKDEEIFYLNGHGRIKTKDLMYLLGIFIGDGFIAYQQKKLDTKTGLPKHQFLLAARDAQTGRFKTIERMDNHIATCHSYRIFFDIPEKDKCRKRVEEVLANLGIKYHRHKGKAGTHLYFTSKVFMDLFAQCGQGARYKKIPRWVLDYSPEYLKYLFDGLMDSDGHKGVIYHTVSERLAIDVCELAVKLNLKPTLRKRHTKSFLDGRKIEGDSYYVCIAKTIKSISRHRNKTVHYKGDIWCLKVEDHKNFLVEREGKFDFCGNTDEVYGEIKKGSFREDSAFAPNSPYAASKAGADLLVKAFIRTYGFPALIVRMSNNYGPWQYPEKLIPVVILKALKDQKIPVYARGHNVREWLHVSDGAAVVLFLSERGRVGEVYNVGSGLESRNIDTVRLLLRLMGKPEGLITYVKDRPGHDFRYSLDCSKVRRLGWRPRVGLREGFADTVRWNQDHRRWLEAKLKDLKSYWKRIYQT